MKVTLFLAYAPEDEAFANTLESSLAWLERIDRLKLYKQNISLVRNETSLHLREAHIILLLVSSDFLNSDYVYRDEIAQAIERHKQGVIHLLPILLRPVYWGKTPFAQLQVMPENKMPMVLWDNQESAFSHVVTTIEQIVMRYETENTSVSKSSPIRPEDVLVVEQRSFSVETICKTAATFALLGDPTRLQIVYALLHASSQEMNVADLSTALDREDTTISHQLRVLRNQRIVAMRKEGRSVFYRIADERIRDLLELALSLAHVQEEQPFLDLENLGDAKQKYNMSFGLESAV
jgi:ArsR family transcriptional regulator, lead/cadmium/zinc/bismuth-responsive transcriptional repressor